MADCASWNMDAGLLSKFSSAGETSVLWCVSGMDCAALRESLLSFWGLAAAVIGGSFRFDMPVIECEEPRTCRSFGPIHLDYASWSIDLSLANFATHLKEGGPSAAATQFTWARTHKEQGRNESH